MTEYAHVDGLNITLGNPPESLALPDGSTISNFNQAPPELLAAHGWHPAVITYAELGPTERHGPAILTFDGTTVTAVYPAESQPPEWFVEEQRAANALTIRAAAAQAVADAATRKAAAESANSVPQLRAVVADLVTLTSRLARLLSDQLDDTD